MRYAGDRTLMDKVNIKISAIESHLDRLRRKMADIDTTPEEIIHLNDVIREDLRYIELEKIQKN